jgi:large repetitive protein
VSLSPASAAFGTTFKLTVTNTGTIQDTFDLSLGGPAALVAKLVLPKVTLAAGASTVVNITTQAVNFAIPGSLDLIGIATSATNPAVQASAVSALQVAGVKAMTAQLNPGNVQVLPVPGTSDFLVIVNNTGNVEDTYSATIMGTSGPVKANLIGLDGQPTQSIATFELPGLSSGAFLLDADIGKTGTGTATVQIDSLTDADISATVTATVTAAPPVQLSPAVYFPNMPVMRSTLPYAESWITLTNQGGAFTGDFTVYLTLPGVTILSLSATSPVEAEGKTSDGEYYITFKGGLRKGQNL